ncbi:MAG: septal ring lytic transglycosylase RlpA family protein, partial [Mesorhizobium sp.]
MQAVTQPRLRRAATVALFAMSAALLAACASQPEPKAMVYKKTRS